MRVTTPRLECDLQHIERGKLGFVMPKRFDTIADFRAFLLGITRQLEQYTGPMDCIDIKPDELRFGPMGYVVILTGYFIETHGATVQSSETQK